MTRNGRAGAGKDPYWWVHPAYRGRQSLDMATLDAMPSGGYRWTRHADAGDGDDAAVMRNPRGAFAEFAQLLYKANGFRAGPVENWYVIVCVEPDARWAVGQLRADPATPLQLFEDLVFPSEAAARECADTLRAG